MQAREPDPLAIARQHPALASLEDALASTAPGRIQLLELPAGQRVFSQGAPCQGLPLVLEGSVRVQVTGASGNEIVLYRIEGGQLCTLSAACLLAHHHHRAEAVTEEPTRAIMIPPGVFDEWMGRSRGFRDYVLRSYGDRLDSLMLLVEQVAFRRMDERLAERLLQLAQDGLVEATHHELAVELGTAREVISRLLKDFERAGLVQLGRGQVRLLDEGRLRQKA
ncbi:MAG: Crp/Fnr family transcriptional regulator [Ectothiorhodospiraceae bacterium]|nr:Crp/Fnr family transcriptional regulator [Ectothiorhodospiraceae bacterium]